MDDEGHVDLTSYENQLTTDAGTFSWYEDAALLSAVATPTDVGVTDNEDYYALFTNGDGCKDTAVVIFTVWEDPDLSLNVGAGEDTALCEGECIDIIAVGSIGDAPYTYTWDNGLGSGSTKNVCPTVTTTYTVTITDVHGCQDTSDITINVDRCPFDLALKMTTSQTMPVKPGNIVPFTITVCNQSDVTVS